MVAELPTCQKTLLGCAPPLSMILPPAPPIVVKLDATWNIQTAFGSP